MSRMWYDDDEVRDMTLDDLAWALLLIALGLSVIVARTTAHTGWMVLIGGVGLAVGLALGGRAWIRRMKR